MAVARYLTLLWPGLPWLWLRGSFMGLVLALAFAVAVDVAVVATCIWSELVEPPVAVALWTAAAVIWLAATVSAVAAFPPALPRSRPAQADGLFAEARDAYLARDWLLAERRLRRLLELDPTDGEAQLLMATLLRRVDRPDEARTALEKLARSDAGRPWKTAIAAELARLDGGGRATADDRPATVPLRGDSAVSGRRDAAA